MTVRSCKSEAAAEAVQFEVGQFEVVSLIAAERSFEGAWP
jgi:hypothetical protein